MCQSWREKFRKTDRKNSRLISSVVVAVVGNLNDQKIKKTNQGETTRIEKIGIQKTGGSFFRWVFD